MQYTKLFNVPRAKIDETINRHIEQKYLVDDSILTIIDIKQLGDPYDVVHTIKFGPCPNAGTEVKTNFIVVFESRPLSEEEIESRKNILETKAQVMDSCYSNFRVRKDYVTGKIKIWINSKYYELEELGFILLKYPDGTKTILFASSPDYQCEILIRSLASENGVELNCFINRIIDETISLWKNEVN